VVHFDSIEHRTRYEVVTFGFQNLDVKWNNHQTMRPDATNYNKGCTYNHNDQYLMRVLPHLTTHSSTIPFL
jgi:hypothetical protein